ncbi:MAG: MogA/MoaB family molybdenum cofactor biosynthesis protein [Coriobacteriales bacterium]|jgi:molybdenum cofactor synthesis domain-containing protein|nr:MogA/MoaB family molybdenum cofactor biosynthesis protein [Coriobacteriales bacterium]
MQLRIALVTCSTTRSLKEDSAGAALDQAILAAGWQTTSHVVVKDEREQIACAIRAAAETAQIVITCGGSGLSLSDVTPEATAEVCCREVPGIAEAIRAYSMQKTHRAMLSRARAMQMADGTLVINFPGSEKAARECWEAVSDQLEHAVRMTNGEGHPTIA